MKILLNKMTFHAMAWIVMMLCINNRAHAQNQPVVFSQAYFRYDSVEIKPAYTGGETAMQSYLSTNLKYPLPALRDSTGGEVKLWFVVEKDGKLSNIKVISGIGKGCDEEAKRLVMNMPPWIPGKYMGKAVATEATITVLFKL